VEKRVIFFAPVWPVFSWFWRTRQVPVNQPGKRGSDYLPGKKLILIGTDLACEIQLAFS
jgi:hypothetical protein